MRRFAQAPGQTPVTPGSPTPASHLPPRSDRETLARLWPYLWTSWRRVLAALAFMVGAKLANVGVPVLLKDLVDTLAPKAGSADVLLVVPVGLLLA